MRKSSVAGIVIMSAAIGACGQFHREGGGATVSRSYEVGNFQKIEVAGPYDIDVHTGANPGVSATGPQKLLDRVTVEVSGDTLRIHPQASHSWFHFGWSGNGGAKFTVNVPQLRSISSAGSGDTSIDKVQGDKFEGSVAGSGGLSIGAADVKALKLSIAGSGETKASAGKAQTAEYQVLGSGDLDAARVQTAQSKISVAGSGNVKANASATADISIMGSGDVTVTGGAKCSVSKAGSGDAHCS